jgi:hypothetical protein
MLLRPPVKNLGERDGLSASRGQVPLQHKHEHDVAFGGEVCDILGHDLCVPKTYATWADVLTSPSARCRVWYLGR